MVDFLYDFHLLAKIMLRGLQFSLYCVRLSASPKGVINMTIIYQEHLVLHSVRKRAESLEPHVGHHHHSLT